MTAASAKRTRSRETRSGANPASPMSFSTAAIGSTATSSSKSKRTPIARGSRPLARRRDVRVQENPYPAPALYLGHAKPPFSAKWSSGFDISLIAFSASRRSLGAQEQSIDAVARRHEQAAAAKTAEADICAALGQVNPTNELAGSAEDHHAVVARAPAPAAPQVAVNVDTQAIRYAAALDGDERSPVGELRAVIDHVVNAKNLRRHAIFYDVQLRLVRREGKPVRTVDVARHHCCPSVFIEPVDVGWQLLRVDDAGIVAGDAVHRIGEPDR